MLSEQQLNDWQRLADEATPGEWYTHEEEPSTIMSWEGDESNAWEVATHVECPDACFICAAREAVPMLIARVRELEKDLDGMAHDQTALDNKNAELEEEANWLADQCARLAFECKDAKVWREAARQSIARGKEHVCEYQ